MKLILISRHNKSEAGLIPALCLSNRDIYERIGVQSQPLEQRIKFWEGIQVGDKDSVGRPVICLMRNPLRQGGGFFIITRTARSAAAPEKACARRLVCFGGHTV